MGGYASPLGPIRVRLREGSLLALGFVDDAEPGPPAPDGVRRALDAYFAGRLDALDALPAAPAGTPFQLRVWAELRRIRPGEALTYAELARRVGQPDAARAVGAANGRNPVALVIPCHRVTAAGGGLGGYAGGVHRKRWLLRHEGAVLGEARGLFG